MEGNLEYHRKKKNSYVNNERTIILFLGFEGFPQKNGKKKSFRKQNKLINIYLENELTSHKKRKFELLAEL